MSVSIVSARLPTGDTPVCNVTLEPYVLIKRGETTVTADDIPEEGSPEPGLQLRSRWYRSSIPRGGAVCSVHPDKEASVQCTICLKSKVAVHLSYHCTAECFRSSWQQHRDYHRQAHANGESCAPASACTTSADPPVSIWQQAAATLFNSRGRTQHSSSDHGVCFGAGLQARRMVWTLQAARWSAAR
jgi:hypothetical protein